MDVERLSPREIITALEELQTLRIDNDRLRADLTASALVHIRLRAGLRDACDGLDEARCLDREGECAQAIDAVCVNLRALLGGGE